MSCPVDHSSLSKNAAASSPTPAAASSRPVDHSSIPKLPVSDASACPVDHKTRSSWSAFLPSLGGGGSTSSGGSSHDTPSPSQDSMPNAPATLSTARETSSIPRAGAGENWVYPSEAQFFAAMARKQHNPQAVDMQVVVPIHNAVNERAWTEILKWEEGRGAEKCGGVKLVSFKGRPGDMTPRARWKTLLGYTAPFDRHDWIVDRCGVQTRYVIDFYSGRSMIAGMPSFYLDVRPALDNWDGAKMRIERFWDRWVGGSVSSPSTAPGHEAKPASS